MQPGWNRLDSQRQLTPRDYCLSPEQFGHHRHARFYLPTGGRAIDAWVAQQQHLIIVDWNGGGRTPSTAELQHHYGVSRQLMSLTALGHRWMGFMEACALHVYTQAER